jgi:hypothetical protein
MRKKLLIFLVAVASAAFIASCVKSDALPVYTPSPTLIFTPGSLKHTADTVNVGDTVQLAASGTVWDTTRTISVFLSATYGGATSGSYNYGNVTAPILVKRVINPTVNSSGLYPWTATILLPGATSVAHKTTLSITATYVYQLTLSSQLPSSMSSSDAGIKTKTVYVK